MDGWAVGDAWTHGWMGMDGGREKEGWMGGGGRTDGRLDGDG